MCPTTQTTTQVEKTTHNSTEHQNVGAQTGRHEGTRHTIIKHRENGGQREETDPRQSRNVVTMKFVTPGEIRRDEESDETGAPEHEMSVYHAAHTWGEEY